MLRRLYFLIGLCVLPGCDGPAPRPNLLLITLDTVRADRLGCYGYERAQTPTLDALAAESWLFEDATSPYPLTLPAHVSIMTGLYPFEHGARNNGMSPRADAIPVAVRLRDAGYRTAAVVGAKVLGRGMGLSGGFDLYDDAMPSDAPERRADATTDAALRALEAIEGEPFFLWVHYFDAHHPYDPPAGYAQGDAYDGEIAFVDAQIQRLLKALGPARDRTAIVVAADHGEAFGEHGERQHGLLIYEPTVRVPLLLRVPGGVGERVRAAASLIDVGPTLLALARVEAPATAHARDLRDVAVEADAARPVVTESILPFYNHGAEPVAAVKQAGWKYVQAPRSELYDLATDPGEDHGLETTRPERAASLAAALAGIHPLEWTTGEVPEADAVLDEETRDMLASLGYVADASRVETRADAKDLVFALDLVREGDRAAARGDAGEAERAYRQALEKVPHNWKATWRLGEYLVEHDRLGEARQLYEAARAANPQNLTVALRLGEVLRLRGDAEAALQELQPLLRAYPEHRAARVERALSLLDLGRTAEAQRDLEDLLEKRDDRQLRTILDELSN